MYFICGADGCGFYYLWTRGEAYVDPGIDYYEQKYQERLVQNLTKKAHSIGFELIPQSVPPSVTDFVSRERPTGAGAPVMNLRNTVEAIAEEPNSLGDDLLNSCILFLYPDS